MAYLEDSKANKTLMNRHKKLVFIVDRVKPVNNEFYLSSKIDNLFSYLGSV